MTKCDVLIVGAGPAGAVAAAVLARAGARVRLVDRAVFPRDKLCGDTVNPGTLRELRRLGLANRVESVGLRVDGMRLSGPGGVAVDGRYPDGLYGRSIARRDLDWLLVQEAMAVGATFDQGVSVRAPIVADSHGEKHVAGVIAAGRNAAGEMHARVTIAADGRRSTLAFALGLARHPAAPRRWAVGAYFENAPGLSSLGEMHIRRKRYIGVAPVPGGLANVCLVLEKGVEPFLWKNGSDYTSVLLNALAADSVLRDRFADARMVGQPIVLGPLAVDATTTRIDGLLTAGDAAGFIDPMTGDGLRFAVRGGALAADAALEALAHGWPGVHDRLAARRRQEFASKWRFNRTLRALVASPTAVVASAVAARVAPGALARIVSVAGDCREAAIEYR